MKKGFVLLIFLMAAAIIIGIGSFAYFYYQKNNIPINPTGLNTYKQNTLPTPTPKKLSSSVIVNGVLLPGLTQTDEYTIFSIQTDNGIYKLNTPNKYDPSRICDMESPWPKENSKVSAKGVLTGEKEITCGGSGDYFKTDETANWKTYTKDSFSIKYPPDYKLSEFISDKTFDIAFSSPDKIADTKDILTQGGTVRILKKEINNNSLAVSFDYFLHGENIQSKFSLNLNGKSAYSGIASAAEGMTEEFKYVVVANNSDGYLIQAWGTKDFRQNIYSIFDSMISTFKFTQ